MQNSIKILPLLILFYSCSSGDSSSLFEDEIGAEVPSPDVKFLNTVNDQFKSDLDKNWIIINYWADWCPPCLKEMPELVSFAESNPDIEVFAYNFDRLEQDYLDPLILRFGVNLPSITSHPREVWGIESPKVLPATYFIKPGGEVVLSLLTPQTEESLQMHLDSLQEDS